MNIKLDDKKLRQFFDGLEQAMANNNANAAIKIHTALDAHIRNICNSEELKPSKAQLQQIKIKLDALSNETADKKIIVGKQIIKQKQNARAIAKYRSI